MQNKTVEVQGNRDFSREPSTNIKEKNDLNLKEETEFREKKEVNQQEDTNKALFKASLTQKMSPAVHIKVNTLRAFLNEEDNIPKTTTNDIINYLIDSYVNNQFTSRQQTAFFLCIIRN